jgi:hypothetical protein
VPFEEGCDLPQLPLRGVARPRGAVFVGFDRCEHIGWREPAGLLAPRRPDEGVAELVFESEVAEARLRKDVGAEEGTDCFSGLFAFFERVPFFWVASYCIASRADVKDLR